MDDITTILVNVLFAIIPSLILCVFVYQKDYEEKEPKSIIFRLFFLGVILTIPAGFIEKLLISTYGYEGTLSEIISILYVKGRYLDIGIIAFLMVALIEEGYKFIFLLIGSWKNKNFNYRYDAIVYAVFLSLGFATIENIYYILNHGSNVALLRGLVAVPAHAIFAIISGLFLGFAKENSVKKKKGKMAICMFFAFILPILLHGLYDFVLFIGDNTYIGALYGTIGVLYFVAYLIIDKTSKGGQIKPNLKKQIPVIPKENPVNDFVNQMPVEDNVVQEKPSNVEVGRVEQNPNNIEFSMIQQDQKDNN